VWVFCCCCIFKSEREEKKSTKKRPKLSRDKPFKTRGIHRQKIKRQKKQSATQTRHTQTRKHKTPESAKRGRYSLYPPVYKRARTHVNTLHIHHAAATTHIKKKLGKREKSFLGCNSTTVCRIRLFRLQPAPVEAGKKYAETF